MRSTLPSSDGRHHATASGAPATSGSAPFDTDQPTSFSRAVAPPRALRQPSPNGVLRAVAAVGLVIGALLGMAGSFAPSAELRGLAWTIDGVALVVASALLAVHHLRRGDEQLAAGFLVFLAGETLIVSGSAMDLAAVAPTFSAGAGLWSAALALVSASRTMPSFVRATGMIAAVLLAVPAVQIAAGARLTPLSEPLPFFAFPFLATTLVGWAWAHWRPTSTPSPLLR